MSEIDPLKHWAESIDDPHFIRVVFDCWKIYRDKGMDYTQGQWEQDRLANFREAAKDAKITMLQCWSALTSKHLHAVRKYVADGRVESEPIEGRIYDVINYMILLLLIVDENRDSALTDKLGDPIGHPPIPGGVVVRR